MECRHKLLRDELDDLGYYQSLSSESVPLVEKLVADLKTTTENLQKYMKLSQRAIEERDNLQLGAEPYKCDNARLVKECNDLHLAFLQYKDENERRQKELKSRLEIAKSENLDCISQKEKLKNRIRELETELIDQGEALLNSKHKKPTSTSKKGRKTINFDLSEAMALSDEKVANLCKDLKRYKEKNLQLVEEVELLKCQLNTRDQEITRLNYLLEGGRPLTAINKDCLCLCGKGSSERVNVMHDEINKLTQEKAALESRLKESLSKQHEAMKRALHLAERNKVLEKELKDIDNLALAVEAECNNTVKNNAEKVNRLQDRMHGTVIQIQNLERDNARLRQEKEELSADLDAVILEKKHLQTVLENSLDEKKRLSDRINNFVIIEHDLNMEIDRLTRLTGDQKRKIAELENSLVSEKVEHGSKQSEILGRVSKQSIPSRAAEAGSKQSEIPGHSSKQSGATNTEVEIRQQSLQTDNRVESTSIQTSQQRRQQTVRRQSQVSPTQSPTRTQSKLSKKKPSNPSKKSRNSNSNASPPQMISNKDLKATIECRCECCKGCCDSCGSTKHLKELLDKEIDYREQQALSCMENLRSEKDYYMKEYHRVLEQMKNVSSRQSSHRSDTGNNSDLVQKLLDKEQVIVTLQQENKILGQEKYDLMKKIDGFSRTREDDDDQPCLKTLCKRTQRERDLLRADLDRLEEEKDTLMQKLKTLTDAQLSDQDRLRRSLNESEEHIRKLELERRELLQDQSSKGALEQQFEAIKEQLRLCQSELNQQKAVYGQLKTLHEQTNRSLTDAQNRLTQTQSELAGSLEKLARHETEKGSFNKESGVLRRDIEVLKQQLTQIDGEKDDLLAALDDKTERLVVLENEIKSKNQTIESLEDMVTDLKKKLTVTREEHGCAEQILRDSQDEIRTLREELDKSIKLKDATSHENRRLQDDLSSVTADCRNSRKELELYRRQVDDLKTQLQQYVAEVKRAEDLISNKEIERSELLDQFRSLSHEANTLENNNHTLETEAAQSKIQLTIALDHASDLERKLEDKESVVRSYERQIGDLTSQVASLEMQLKQGLEQYEQVQVDLVKMRDLCESLQAENGNIKRQLRAKLDEKLLVDRSVDKLMSEREVLQRTMSLEKRSVETVERDLDEAKRETTELRILNQDLQEEVQRLKIQVQELKERLYHCVCVPSSEPSKSKENASADANKTSEKTLQLDDTILQSIPEASVNLNNITKEPQSKKCNNSTCFYRGGGKLKCQKCGRPKENGKIGGFQAEKNEKTTRNWRFSKTGSTMTEPGCISVINKNCKLCDDCVVRSYFTVDNGTRKNNVVNYTFVHELQCPKSSADKPDRDI